MKVTAASLGMLLAIRQASDFHRGLSGLRGKASLMVKAAVNVLTDVLGNGYRSYGLGKRTQLHLYGKLPKEYNLGVAGGDRR